VGLSGRATIMEGKTDGEFGVMSSPGLSILCSRRVQANRDIVACTAYYRLL